MTERQIRHYAETIRSLATEAMHDNLHGGDISRQLMLIELCASAIGGSAVAVAALGKRRTDAEDDQGTQG